LSFTNKTFSGKVPDPTEYDSNDNFSLGEIGEIAREVGSLLSQLEIDKSLKRILRFSNHFNQYFQIKQPWAHRQTAKTTLFIAVNAVRSIAIMLEPFIPFSCEKIWCQLGMSDSVHQQSWPSVSEIRIPGGHLLGKVEPIFTKIDREVIVQQKEILGMDNG